MVALAAACVSDSPNPGGYTAVPPERMYSPRLLDRSPQTAEITIRKIGGGLFGKSCFGRLLLENRPVAEMHDWEQVVLYLARGQYSFAYLPQGLCQGRKTALEIQVQPEEARMFEIQDGSNNNFTIVEVGG